MCHSFAARLNSLVSITPTANRVIGSVCLFFFCLYHLIFIMHLISNSNPYLNTEGDIITATVNLYCFFVWFILCFWIYIYRYMYTYMNILIIITCDFVDVRCHDLPLSPTWSNSLPLLFNASVDFLHTYTPFWLSWFLLLAANSLHTVTEESNEEMIMPLCERKLLWENGYYWYSQLLFSVSYPIEFIIGVKDLCSHVTQPCVRRF